MEVERDPITEAPPPRVLEMQTHVRSAAVAGVANTAKHLDSRHAIADRDPYRTWLQVPNEQIFVRGHLKADVVTQDRHAPPPPPKRGVLLAVAGGKTAAAVGASTGSP